MNDTLDDMTNNFGTFCGCFVRSSNVDSVCLLCYAHSIVGIYDVKHMHTGLLCLNACYVLIVTGNL